MPTEPQKDVPEARQASSVSLPLPPTVRGSDTKGNVYKTADAMWKKELQGDLYDPCTGWYGKALDYWRHTPADIGGVLGGLGELHTIDIPETKKFLEQYVFSSPAHRRERALDCAAGIGRVAKHLLCPLYATVDLLEPLPHMLEQAKRELEGFSIGEFMLSSMETADLPKGKYDLVMIQWAVIYLTDADFVRFFASCKAALREGGFVVLKENCSSDDSFLVDKEDSSLTRSDKHYKALFKAAGLTVIGEASQKKWEANLIPVKMYALQ